MGLLDEANEVFRNEDEKERIAREQALLLHSALDRWQVVISRKSLEFAEAAITLNLQTKLLKVQAPQQVTAWSWLSSGLQPYGAWPVFLRVNGDFNSGTFWQIGVLSDGTWRPMIFRTSEGSRVGFEGAADALKASSSFANISDDEVERQTHRCFLESLTALR